VWGFLTYPLSSFLPRCTVEEKEEEEEDGGAQGGREADEEGTGGEQGASAVSPKRRQEQQQQQQQERRRQGRRELLEAVLTVGPPVRGARPSAEGGGSKVGEGGLEKKNGGGRGAGLGRISIPSERTRDTSATNPTCRPPFSVACLGAARPAPCPHRPPPPPPPPPPPHPPPPLPCPGRKSPRTAHLAAAALSDKGGRCTPR
jgi:hypothetical protein